LAYTGVFLAGLAWTATMMARSPGAANHDEITHVLIARDAWRDPGGLLNPFGRPFNTILYALPALWGMTGARVASLAFSILTVIVLTHLARSLGLRRLYLIPLFMWFQPWFADLSYTAMTEVPFALLLVCGLVLAAADRDDCASIAFGLLPLVRYEGIVITAAWCLYRLVRGRPGNVLISIAPLLAYEVAYALAFHRSAMGDVYFTAKPPTLYGTGGWTHFLPAIYRGVGPAVLGLGAVGVVLWRRGRPRAGAGVVVAVAYALYFGVHTILYRFGLFASGGYALFLLPLAPGAGLAAALGAEGLVASAGRVRFVSAKAARAVAVGLVSVAAVAAIAATLRVPPRPLDREGIAVEQAIGWLKAHGSPRTSIVASHPWFFLFYDYPRRPFPPLGATPSASLDLPRGTLMIWDRHYSDRVGFAYARLTAQGSGWVREAEFGQGLVVVFRKTA
jgi:hypothetical protein